MRECSYREISKYMKMKEVKKLGLDLFYISDDYKGFCIGINKEEGVYTIKNIPEILTIKEEELVRSITGVEVKTFTGKDADQYVEAIKKQRNIDKILIAISISLILYVVISYIIHSISEVG